MTPQELLVELQTHSINKQRPDSSNYRSLSLTAEQTIAQTQNISLKDVQVAALHNDIIPERYARNQTAISTTEQIAMLETKVAVIGLGGLGGAVTEILSRIGIGSLILVDGDCFDESNLNRQLLSSVEVLGQMKALTARKRVQAINPAIEVLSVEHYLRDDNSDSIIADADIVVDCLDNITDRFILEQCCIRKDIPLVSAAIGGSSGQVTVIIPGETGLERIYGSRDKAKKRGIEASLGTLPFAATATAALECAEVVAFSAKKSPRLKGKLLLADFNHFTMDTVTLS